jgi:transglutaminase-like putative cysteine protease
MNYLVTHATEFSYASDVAISHNLVHLRPRDTPRQRCIEHVLATSVPGATMIVGVDFFGNDTAYFTIEEPHGELSVSARNLVRVETDEPEIGGSLAWESIRDRLRVDLAPVWLDAAQFRFDSPMIREIEWLREYAAAEFPAGRPILEAALGLTTRIHE